MDKRSLVIKNGKVYDPLNKIDGRVQDIFIKDGKIVEKIEEGENPITIDATGKIVAPANIDIHSHIAGPKVNSARLMRPEDHIRDPFFRRANLRSGCGFSIPTTFVTAYRYLLLGYGTVMDPAVPPLKARHAFEELEDMPVIDKGVYVLMGNNNILYYLMKKGDRKAAKLFAAWLLKSAGGYAIKVVNPGGTDSWKWGKVFNSLHEETPWGIKPKAVVDLLNEVVEEFRLPHPVHLHTYNLGIPGNYKAALETIKAFKDNRIHLTHLQFFSYGGDGWSTFRSESVKVAEALSECEGITADMGQVIFEETTTMTADTPWEFTLFKLVGGKWSSADIELETGGGIVPYRYRMSNIVNAVQWAVGLELALLLGPWKIVMTTDHPNGGPFYFYPEVIKWLTSFEARKEIIEKLPPKVKKRIHLHTIDKEFSLSEMITMLSAAPAKILGMKNKGHLGLGADADIVIYDPKDTVYETLSSVSCMIKDGKVVVRDGEIVDASFGGKVIRVDTGVDDGALSSEIKELFDRFYSVRFANYKVEDVYFEHGEVIRNVA
ncbi:MAG: formylmethanofuran dehydrogenase subunit A [Synergistetes bacterium]|nr:formylmethanofuran dehydrogenase subunit A [Synergistota bacterium]